MEITWSDISGKGRGRENGRKVQGIRSINDKYKIGGEVKNSVGYVEEKQLISTTNGHEL